jgi:hypothetical protein
MKGDDLVRHCNHCNSKVYDLSALEDDEIITFVKLHSGKVCGKLQMTKSGHVIDGKCQQGEQTIVGRIVVRDDVEKVERSLAVSEKRTKQLKKLLELIKNRPQN